MKYNPWHTLEHQQGMIRWQDHKFPNYDCVIQAVAYNPYHKLTFPPTSDMWCNQCSCGRVHDQNRIDPALIPNQQTPIAWVHSFL